MELSHKENHRKGHDILPKILCFVAAFVLWLYVTQVETSDYEETFNGVTVDLVNTNILESNAGLHVYSGHGNTVNVTVSGRKSDINRYSSDNIRLYADVSEITESGRHSVPVISEIPDGLTVSKMSVSFINVYVDATSTIETDVRPKVSSAIIGDGCELGEITPEYPLVTVTGPKTVLNDIDYAQISLDLGEIKSTLSTIAPLELIGKNGDAIDMRYVQLNRSEVKVTVPVSTTKEVPVSVNFKHGLYNEKNVKIEFEPSTVSIKGDPLELEKISEIVVGTLDEKNITSNVMQVYKLTLPEGVSATEKVENINVTVSHIGTAVRSYSVDSITVDGIETGKYELITKTFTVRARGEEADLNKINPKDIKVSVNLSEYGNSVSGTVTVNASVSLGKNAGSAYAVGDCPVQIKIG